MGVIQNALIQSINNLIYSKGVLMDQISNTVNSTR